MRQQFRIIGQQAYACAIQGKITLKNRTNLSVIRARNTVQANIPAPCIPCTSLTFLTCPFLFYGFMSMFNVMSVHLPVNYI